MLLTVIQNIVCVILPILNASISSVSHSEYDFVLFRDSGAISVEKENFLVCFWEQKQESLLTCMNIR